MKVKKNSDEYTIILVELEEVNNYSYMFSNFEIKEFCLLGGDDKKENIEQNKIENNKENKALDLSKSNNSFYDINEISEIDIKLDESKSSIINLNKLLTFKDYYMGYMLMDVPF